MPLGSGSLPSLRRWRTGIVLRVMQARGPISRARAIPHRGVCLGVVGLRLPRPLLCSALRNRVRLRLMEVAIAGLRSSFGWRRILDAVGRHDCVRPSPFLHDRWHPERDRLPLPRRGLVAVRRGDDRHRATKPDIERLLG